jgi:hypothetical protein
MEVFAPCEDIGDAIGLTDKLMTKKCQRIAATSDLFVIGFSVSETRRVRCIQFACGGKNLSPPNL